ncbi:MAG: S41 family peptidase [Patescibacteria group bacterium]|nr:S41 family peptidase [Patescibacteria group bacterium]
MKKDETKEQKNKKIKIGIILISVFILGWFFGSQDAKISRVGFTPKLIERDSSESSADFSVFWRAWDLIVEKYDGEVDFKKMIYGAIKGMSEALGDPYTVFMTPEESQALENELSGVIYGIGAEIGIKNDKLTVISPLSGSPAEEAGLMPGDIIIKIDDEETTKMSVDEAVSKIRGKEGTNVVLTIARGKTEKTYKIKRSKITIKSVNHEIIEENIGYIEITRFDEKTTTNLRKALDEFASKNIEKIILDLRGNPGGYLDQSISVSSEFLEKGVIVTEKKDVDTNGKRYEYKASGRGKMTDKKYKIVVLVNEGSASAAEIVAGALKDHKRATIVGETTFGKGSVQEIENLSGGAKMRITVAHWYTPNGQNIAKSGIKPDIEAKLTEEDYDKGRDPQLKRAISILNK